MLLTLDNLLVGKFVGEWRVKPANVAEAIVKLIKHKAKRL
jgi:hypothetical protein